MSTEPSTDAEMTAWIEDGLRATDPYRWLAEATDAHRAGHGCTTFASHDGSLLGVLVRLTGAERVLEIGTALGYSAAWLAHGAPTARIDSLEADPTHAALARGHLADLGLSDRVTVHDGRSPDALDALTGPYDLVVYDAWVPSPIELAAFGDRLRIGGTLVSANLFLGRYLQEEPDLAQGAAYREALLHGDRWLTSFAGSKAVSIRLA
jgi:predicted O-methyltransferase YrrM